jgi:hypothetical protein
MDNPLTRSRHRAIIGALLLIIVGAIFGFCGASIGNWELTSPQPSAEAKTRAIFSCLQDCVAHASSTELASLQIRDIDDLRAFAGRHVQNPTAIRVAFMRYS